MSIFTLRGSTATSASPWFIRSSLRLFVVTLLVTVFAAINASAHPATALAASNDGGRDSAGRTLATLTTREASSTPTTRLASPVEVQVRWWGLIVSLDRSTGCDIVQGLSEAEALLNAIPPPWKQLVILGLRLQRDLIASRMGAEGVELHINWAGIVHWAQPRGPLRAC
jgi:hypothetical protein